MSPITITPFDTRHTIAVFGVGAIHTRWPPAEFPTCEDALARALEIRNDPDIRRIEIQRAIACAICGRLTLDDAPGGVDPVICDGRVGRSCVTCAVRRPQRCVLASGAVRLARRFDATTPAEMRASALELRALAEVLERRARLETPYTPPPAPPLDLAALAGFD